MAIATHPAPRAPLGLRLPPSAIPAVAWNAWRVVPRAHGFHVSRESAGGTATDFLRNEVRQVKVFRKRELAQAACDAANRGAS